LKYGKGEEDGSAFDGDEITYHVDIWMLRTPRKEGLARIVLI
jgi:hypothetical protein